MSNPKKTKVDIDKLLRFIFDYNEQHGFPPSMREICGHMGVSKNNYPLAVAKELGYIEVDPRKSMSIKITEQGLDKIGEPKLRTLKIWDQEEPGEFLKFYRSEARRER